MINLKICTQCNLEKILETEFYLCAGVYRSECKKCTIKKNSKYQSKEQTWKKRDKQHMREYYQNNKDKFKKQKKTGE